MKNYKVKQCCLELIAPVYKDKRVTTQRSWIPEKFAVLDKTLVFDEDKRSTCWKVIQVYDGTMEISECIERSQDYKRTRKASDI